LLVDRSFISAATLGTSDGAPIGIDMQVAGNVTLTNGTQVTTDVFGGGDAGAIRVSADRIEISNGAILGSRAFVNSSGDTGNIDITARNVQMTRGGRVASETFSGSRGNAGNVTLQEVDTLVLRDAARISGVLYTSRSPPSSTLRRTTARPTGQFFCAGRAGQHACPPRWGVTKSTYGGGEQRRPDGCKPGEGAGGAVRPPWAASSRRTGPVAYAGVAGARRFPNRARSGLCCLASPRSLSSTVGHGERDW
jgi:hypothetical protein